MSELASVIDEVKKLEAASYEQSVRVYFLRNLTVEGIEPFLKLHLLQSGIKPAIQYGDYGVIDQAILDETSQLHAAQPDIVMLALELETFDPGFTRLGWTHDDVLARIRQTLSLLLRSTRAVIGINTFLPPAAADYGIAIPDGPDRTLEVLKLDVAIRELVQANPGRVFLADFDGYARRLGEEAIADRRFWYMSKAPFKKALLDAYARDIAKATRALKGKAKKVLVLDCDGTLWGGVIGEDGLDGIKLDPNSYPGNAYVDFQRTVLTLAHRGVVLALATKNNPDDVYQVLDTHPHCLLKREHFAAERINWQDKASNIRSLAEELNVGLDSFVFVDDNPAECGLIRELVPQVTVLQVPAAIYTYRDLVLATGLFDTLSITSEDRARVQMYRSEKERTRLEQSAASVDEYLASLEMVATIHEITASEVPRVAQLTQKTNQFNLTTRRYSESQIEGFRTSADHKVFSLSVKDRFGDMGLTGVVIARRAGTAAVVDSLLMSCRILGRRIEHALLEHCFAAIERAWRPAQWHAEYLPTRKNDQVKTFWSDAGFSVVETTEAVTRYSLEASARTARHIPFIEVKE